MSKFKNSVHLSGQIINIYPPKYFEDSDDSMVIFELRTEGEEGVYNHHISLINELMDEFFHKFETGCFISVEGCLRPRPKFNDPNKTDIFFEIRGTSIHAIDDQIASADHSVIEGAGNTCSDTPPPITFVQNGVKHTSELPKQESANWVCSPSQPISAKSIYQANQDDSFSWVGGVCNYNGRLVTEVDFLNGAPIDKTLPFFPLVKENTPFKQ